MKKITLNDCPFCKETAEIVPYLRTKKEDKTKGFQIMHDSDKRCPIIEKNQSVLSKKVYSTPEEAAEAWKKESERN